MSDCAAGGDDAAWFFEDFTAGQSLPPGEVTVGEDDAAWFAGRFAPHALEAATWPDARRSGQRLSGWHVSALGMRLICDAFLYRTASLGAPGVDDVEWPQPVLVGDRLRLDGRISTVRVSRSRPDMGLVGFEFSMTNQNGACVMRQSNVMLVQRRAQGAEP